jgi:hypothetical protein
MHALLFSCGVLGHGIARERCVTGHDVPADVISQCVIGHGVRSAPRRPTSSPSPWRRPSRASTAGEKLHPPLPPPLYSRALWSTRLKGAQAQGGWRLLWTRPCRGAMLGEGNRPVGLGMERWQCVAGMVDVDESEGLGVSGLSMDGVGLS